MTEFFISNNYPFDASYYLNKTKSLKEIFFMDINKVL
jgi:hypothetical protein